MHYVFISLSYDFVHYHGILDIKIPIESILV